MLCLAITWVLILTSFFYFRYKMAQYDNRLDLLTRTIQTMAGGMQMKYSESETESDEESESEEEPEESDEPEKQSAKVIKLEESRYPLNVYENKDDSEESKLDEPKLDVSDEEEVSDTTQALLSPSEELVEVNEVKEIELKEPTLEDLTVKELKEKVSLLNGPKLKTKKELIDFLQNKI